MDGLAELQSLSALAKVGEMLRNHLDVDQPALAEFVIHLAKRSRDLEDFGRLLDENGAELGFDFVGQLYRTILALDPPSKGSEATNFPGLGIRNDPEAARKADPGDTNDDILEESGGDRRRRSPSRSPEKARRDRRSRSREALRRSPSRSPDRRDRRRRSPRRSRSRSRDGHRRRRSRSRDRRGRRSPTRSRSRSRDDRRRPKRSLSPIQKELPPAAPEPPSGVGFARRRYITDLDRWEAQQLLKTGALSAPDRSALRAEIEEAPEEPDIYVNPTPPDFLRGQTIRSGIALSPIRLAAKPEGSLSRTIAAAVAAQREAPSAPGPPARGAGAGGAAGGMHFPSAPDGADSVPHPPPGPSVPIAEQRKGLPIFRLREEIVDEICSNKIVIVLGETGSGKTTQIPQYLCEAGFCDYAAFLKAISSRTREAAEDNSRRSGEKRMIGITQPRRVSAISVARRVAEEFGCSLGAEVGYSIRFRDETSAKTVIKFMTDGMLLREILADPGLSAYSTIMLDEAHERTIATDVLFSLLKETSSARRDFRLVVTSATLEAEKFSEYFFSAPIFRIPGRAFPVEVLHAREEEADYLERALATVLQIHLNEPPGDILLFLTGQDDIERACSALEGRLAGLKRLRPPPLAVLPVFSALPVEIQQQIFLPAPPGTRKCVVATNIAEASITIDGILYVVDPGLCKLKSYDPRTGVESLVISPISQANARQRAGRAGRTAPGKCFRLYTEAAFREEMLPTPVPEIQRSNLLSVVIILKSMGINDFLNFDFMDRPSSAMLVDSLDILFHLGALDTEGLLTRLGRRMAQFPVDPCLAKMLLFSAECGVADAVATIVAMLSVQNIFYRPAERREKADAARAKFFQPEGDLAALVAVYEAWARSGHSQHYCYQNFLQVFKAKPQHRGLLKAQEIRKQLIIILDRYGPGRRGGSLCIKGPSDSSATGPLGRMEKIQRSVLSGLFHHAARRGEDGYRTLLDEQVVLIHPSSCLHRRSPDYVVYFELVLTTREYMRDLTVVRPSWLSELAPTLYSTVPRAGPGARGAQRSSGAPAVAPMKLKPLHNRLLKDQDEWRLAKRKL